MTDDHTEGTLNGWPVSLQIQRDLGGVAHGAHCAAYSGNNDEPSPLDIQTRCEEITDACDGLKPAAAMRKARSMGFVPD
jgi:hypothetical protein